MTSRYLADQLFIFGLRKQFIRFPLTEVCLVYSNLGSVSRWCKFNLILKIDIHSCHYVYPIIQYTIPELVARKMWSRMNHCILAVKTAATSCSGVNVNFLAGNHWSEARQGFFFFLRFFACTGDAIGGGYTRDKFWWQNVATKTALDWVDN